MSLRQVTIASLSDPLLYSSARQFRVQDNNTVTIDSIEQDMSKSHVAAPHKRGQHISLSFAPGPSRHLERLPKLFAWIPPLVSKQVSPFDIALESLVQM